MPDSRVPTLRPHFALFAVLTGFLISALTMISWIFDLPILRTLLPGFPSMIPTTALMVSLLGVMILLALKSRTEVFSRPREYAVLLLTLFTMLATLGNFSGYVFSVPLAINLSFLTSDVPLSIGMVSSGKLSVQATLASLFLAITVMLDWILNRLEHRISDGSRKRIVFLIQLLPALTMGICLLAAIGYLQNKREVPGATKFLGLSLPTLISFMLLGLCALQLRRREGNVALLAGDGSAGLLLRRFVLLSVLGPLIITTFISWGEASALYPDSFSLSLFVLFTVSALTATSFFTADAIRINEDQRIEFERAKNRMALQETEESLRETKDRLQFALDASAMGTWESELKTGHMRLSNTTEALFGLNSGTFSGRTEEFESLIHPDDVESMANAQQVAIAEHRDLDIDFRCNGPNGLSRWLRLKGRATYDTNGTPEKISGTILDITREKFHQKTIEDALQAAQSANDLKSNFLASMSHEIRTPLGAILGFTELLRDPDVEPNERDEYLKIITRNGETLSQLINDILDLSKVEAGHMNIENIRFVLKSTTEEVATLLRNRAEKKGIDLSITYSDDLPTFVVSDPVRLKQILFNLVGNSIKFTLEGKVSIQVTRGHGSESGSIHFDVHDTGIGIRAEQREFLFRPFIQADGSITRRFGGTGLGLSLSKNLAQLLGGDVKLLESVLEKGSVFRATIENRGASDALIVAENARAANKAPKDFENIVEKIEFGKTSLADFKILVVDDSIDNQNLISHILKRFGANLNFADDGLQAKTKALETAYDLILMDLQMPVLDGIAATEAIRKQGFLGPIIALTAHAMKDTNADCLRAGCSGFLSKPIDSQNLVLTIHRFLKDGPTR